MSLPGTVVVPAGAGRPTLQGIPVGSLNEYNVGRGLTRARHEYVYQYRLEGARGVVGDFRIDFLVLSTVPLATPLEVFSEYWHRGELKPADEFRLRQIEAALMGEADETVIFWGNESETEEEAYRTVIEKLGPG